MAVKEEQGAERLILGGDGDVFIGCEVRKEGFNFGGTHFGGVAFVVEEDEAADPLDVGLLGAVGIVAGAQGGAHLV